MGRTLANQNSVTENITVGVAVSSGDLISRTLSGVNTTAFEPNSQAGTVRPPYVNGTAYINPFPLNYVGVTLVGSNVQSPADVNVLQAKRLTNGNFVVVWRESSTGNVKFMIVDASLIIVVAATTVANSSSSATYIGLVALTGGGFVVSYPANSTRFPTFAVYTNAGGVTTGPTTAASAIGEIAAICPSGTGFALAYHPQGITAASLGTFTSTGAVNVAMAALTGTGVSRNTVSYYRTLDLVQLSGGNLAMGLSHGDGTDGTITIQTFTSARVAVSNAATVFVSGSRPEGHQIVLFPDAADCFWITLCNINGGFQARRYNASGVAQSTLNALPSTSISTTGNHQCVAVAIDPLNSARAAFMTPRNSTNSLQAFTNSGGTGSLVATIFDPTAQGPLGLAATPSGQFLAIGQRNVALVANGCTSLLDNSASAASSPTAMAVGNGPVVVIPYTNSTDASVATFVVFRVTSGGALQALGIATGPFEARSPMAVALASGAALSSVRSLVKGRASLRVPSSGPYTINATTGLNKVQGQNLDVSGATADLGGYANTRVRNQIN